MQNLHDKIEIVQVVIFGQGRIFSRPSHDRRKTVARRSCEGHANVARCLCEKMINGNISKFLQFLKSVINEMELDTEQADMLRAAAAVKKGKLRKGGYDKDEKERMYG